MDILYKPNFVLKNKWGVASEETKLHEANLSVDKSKPQLDVERIFLSNKDIKYNIYKIFIKGISDIKADYLSFKDVNISFFVNKEYVAFYPQEFSDLVINKWRNKSDILTYEDFLIKSLIE